MTDEQNRIEDARKRIEDAPEVEGQAKRFHEPVADVEGHGAVSDKVADETEPATIAEKGDDEQDEPEVEGQAKRFH